MKEFGARSNGAQKRNGGGYLSFCTKIPPHTELDSFKDKSNGQSWCLLITFDHEKTFRNHGYRIKNGIF